jgi:nucleoside-triphosphatase THEP1
LTIRAGKENNVKGTGEAPDRPLRILLVGERKSGKTTCCLNAARLMRTQGLRPGGVICPKLCETAGQVIGIEVLNILSEPPTREVLARTDSHLDGPILGEYHFSQRGMQFAREALEAGARFGGVVFADELGPLEMRGEGFSNLIGLARTLSTPPMVIVVRSEMVSEVCRELEPIPVTVLRMNSSNRDKTPARLLELLQSTR